LAIDNTGTYQNVYAKNGFPIADELSRTDNFPGTILYYFEITNMSTLRFVTFSNNNRTIRHIKNSGIFALDSQLEISQHMALGLEASQILMLFKKVVVIIAGYPEQHISLKGQMARLNLTMAMGM
jgi:hypothetical protein